MKLLSREETKTSSLQRNYLRVKETREDHEWRNILILNSVTFVTTSLTACNQKTTNWRTLLRRRKHKDFNGCRHIRFHRKTYLYYTLRTTSFDWRVDRESIPKYKDFDAKACDFDDNKSVFEVIADELTPSLFQDKLQLILN